MAHPDTRPISSARGLHVGRYLPQPVSVLGPATILSPSFLLVQAIFGPNLFPYKYSNIFIPSHPSSEVVMLDTTCSELVWRVLATHSIRQFPLHFPSLASPCAITFQLDSTRYSYLTLKKHETVRQIFEKNHQTSDFTKIRPVGAELFHADCQTWRG